MSTIKMNLYENERCKITHQQSEVIITTDRPIEYGGKGRSFSSTDLVSAGLGSCILTTIEPIFKRTDYDPKQLELSIVKELSQKPQMIKLFTIKISFSNKIEDSLKKKVLKAIETCPVKRSLGEEVEISVELA
jgi:putative redox protein